MNKELRCIDVGCPKAAGWDVHPASLPGHASLREADLVIWDMTATGPIKDGWEDTLKARKADFDILFDRGIPLVVLNASHKYWRMFDIEPLIRVQKHGVNLSFHELVVVNLKGWLEKFSYNHFIKNNKGRAIMWSKNKDYVVSEVFVRGNSAIIALPAIDPKHLNEHFYNGFVRLADDLVQLESNDLNLPPLADKYCLSIQEPITARIRDIKENLARLETELDGAINEFSSLERLKILFTGQDAELEKVVAEVFENMGFEVAIDPNNGRADLIIKHEDFAAVVEIKGKSKSAAERDVIQAIMYNAAALTPCCRKLTPLVSA